jgi:hypothetical protein
VKLREVIDIRRARGYLAAALAPAPHPAPYVVSRTLADMQERARQPTPRADAGRLRPA